MFKSPDLEEIVTLVKGTFPNVLLPPCVHIVYRRLFSIFVAGLLVFSTSVSGLAFAMEKDYKRKRLMLYGKNEYNHAKAILK